MIALAVKVNVFAWLALPVVTLLKVHLLYNPRHRVNSLYSVQSNSTPGFAVHGSLLPQCDHKASCYPTVLELRGFVVGPGSSQEQAAVLLECSKNKK